MLLDDVPSSLALASACWHRLALPSADCRAGDDWTGIGESGSGKGQRFKSFQRGEGELSAIAIGDCDVAHESFLWSEICRCPLQKHTWSAGMLFDGFAQRANVVRTDERVLPGKRRGMAGI